MSIDWFTFTAQILNFLLLVWLMKRFLYGPITSAMQQREARIAAEIIDAQNAQQAANVLQIELQTKLREQENSSDQLKAAAGREVDLWRQHQLSLVQADTDSARAQWYASLQREKQSVVQQLQLEITQQATSLSEHLLQQLADERLQTQMVTTFLDCLSEKSESTSGVGELMLGGHSIEIESSHPLNQHERSLISDAIKDLGASQPPEYQVNSELICGIQLRSPSCKLAWSINDSLGELDSQLVDSVQRLIPVQSPNHEPLPEESTAR